MTQIEEIGTARRSSSGVLAHAVSEVLAPVVLAYLTCVPVAVATTSSVGRGMLIGLVVATLCAGLPYLLIVLSSRRRLLSGRHVPDLRERPVVLVGCAVSATAGLASAVLLDAPREVVALVVATVVGLVVAAVISRWWKVSIHLAGVAGALSAITLVTSWWALVALPVVVILGWARVRLAAHDAAQVAAGALIGAAITTALMVWIS